MKLTENLIAFIRTHSEDDTSRLLLNASRYPDVDVPFAVEQIRSRKQIKEKLPSWYKNDSLVFPSKIAAEQCSSELTALYKQELVGENEHLCDLPGGLGIDSYYFSRKAKTVTYIERFENYADTARGNFKTLQADNITVLNGNGEELAGTTGNIDVFYLDPARRGEGNKRVFALSDCEPDLISLYPELLKKAPRVIAKISPMADIMHTLNLLPQTAEVHVVSVRNECKELLFVMERERAAVPVKIICANLLPDGEIVRFEFTPEQEREAVAIPSDKVEDYLYEPNASLLKAGAFKALTTSWPVKKLHVNSHLYTSAYLIPDFPGRIFQVDEVMPFSSGLCKRISADLPQANITVRNFPLTVDALRKKTKIKDGGAVYVFATTLGSEEKVLIRCRKVESKKQS